MATLTNRIPWTNIVLDEEKIPKTDPLEAWLQQPNSVPSFFLKEYDHLPPFVAGKRALTTKLSGRTSIQYFSSHMSDGDIGRANIYRRQFSKGGFSEAGEGYGENQDVLSGVDDDFAPLVKKAVMYFEDHDLPMVSEPDYFSPPITPRSLSFSLSNQLNTPGLCTENRPQIQPPPRPHGCLIIIAITLGFVSLSSFLGVFFTTQKAYGYSMGDAFTLAGFVMAIGGMFCGSMAACHYPRCQCWSWTNKVSVSSERADESIPLVNLSNR